MPVGYDIVGDQLTTMLEMVEATYSDDAKTGLAKGTVRFKGLWPTVVTQVYALTAHPDFSFLTLISFKVTRDVAETAFVDANFEGVSTAAGGGTGIVKSYKLTSSASAEPIETHVAFPFFGGFPDGGKDGINAQGATFDKKGKFTGFAVEPSTHFYYAAPPAPTPANNTNKAGAESYLAIGSIYTEKATYADGSWPGYAALDFDQKGKVHTPPTSPLFPPVVAGQTWLMITFTTGEAGKGFTVDRAWRLSSTRGWDVDIYT